MLSLPKHLSRAAGWATATESAVQLVARETLARASLLLGGLLWLSLLGQAQTAQAQQAFLRPPCLCLYDLAKLDFYAHQLRRQGVQTLLIYQPVRILDTLVTSGRDSTVTYLLWADDHANWVRRITRTTVSEPLKLSGYGLLTYVRQAHCAAVQGEDNLKFVPPIITSDRGFIGYNGPTASTYFEVNPSTYAPDSQRQIAREHFLLLLNQQITMLRAQWQQAKRYQRPEVVLDGKKCHGLLFGK